MSILPKSFLLYKLISTLFIWTEGIKAQDVWLYSQTEVDNFNKNITQISGNLRIEDTSSPWITNLDSLYRLSYIVLPLKSKR